MHHNAGVSGIILAGGKNTRMGTEKALLQIGGKPIIEIISTALKSITGEIIIVSNNPGHYADYGDRVVADIIPGCGPLGGIHAGLTHTSYQVALVTPCDTPFVSTNLARLLIEHSAGYDIVMPRYRGFLEPLFALYNKSCLDTIEARLKQGHNKITRVIESLILEGVKVRYLEEDKLRAAEPELERVFLNVNTPTDLTKAQNIARVL